MRRGSGACEISPPQTTVFSSLARGWSHVAPTRASGNTNSVEHHRRRRGKSRSAGFAARCGAMWGGGEEGGDRPRRRLLHARGRRENSLVALVEDDVGGLVKALRSEGTSLGQEAAPAQSTRRGHVPLRVAWHRSSAYAAVTGVVGAWYAAAWWPTMRSDMAPPRRQVGCAAEPAP